MPIIIETPYTPPPVQDRPEWPGIESMTWTGWDGTVWDLTGRTGGVSLQAGVRGLAMPPVDRYSNQSPAIAGSRWRGYRTLEREVFWPTRVFSDAGSQAWLEYDRAFWDTMRPDQVGVWEVEQPNGESRRLRLRFLDDGQATFDRMPSLLGWARYGITLVAEQPYWEADPVTRTWNNPATQPFFGGSGGGGMGPLFYISSGSSIVSAAVDNPGDVDAYPVYTITGPVTSVSVGYKGNTVSLGAIPAGQQRIVDTRPDRLTVTDAVGNDKWSELGSNSKFDAPIPPGKSVPLSLSMVGTGTVSLALTPLYYRAW